MPDSWLSKKKEMSLFWNKKQPLTGGSSKQNLKNVQKFKSYNSITAGTTDTERREGEGKKIVSKRMIRIWNVCATRGESIYASRRKCLILSQIATNFLPKSKP